MAKEVIVLIALGFRLDGVLGGGASTFPYILPLFCHWNKMGPCYFVCGHYSDTPIFFFRHMCLATTVAMPAQV